MDLTDVMIYVMDELWMNYVMDLMPLTSSPENSTEKSECPTILCEVILFYVLSLFKTYLNVSSWISILYTD